MKTKVIYSNKAIKYLKQIRERDAQKILKKIKYYIAQEDPFQYAKKLNHR